MNGRGALTWARIAGGAWLVGFALFVYVGIGPLLRLELGALLIGLLTYGLWALLLGLRLVRRPTRVVLIAWLIFAVVLLALYAPLLVRGGSALLAYGPDAVAGAASLAALLLERRGK